MNNTTLSPSSIVADLLDGYSESDVANFVGSSNCNDDLVRAKRFVTAAKNSDNETSSEAIVDLFDGYSGDEIIDQFGATQEQVDAIQEIISNYADNQ